jgi:sialate O-acetylesterase
MKPIVLAIALGVVSSSPAADVLPFVSPVFGDHMVLQRDKPNTIWGWTKPNTEVRMEVAGKGARTVSGDDGRWSIRFTPPPAGGPYTVVLDGPEHQELHDVLVGDVWLCGGQSNMEFSLARSNGGDEAIKNAARPGIRLFTAASQVGYQPLPVPKGEWKTCTPETSAGFSAVGYHFGLRIHEDQKVPVGLVQCAIGGTPAESWTSAEALRRLGDFNHPLDEVARLRDRGGPQYGNFIAHWYDEHDQGHKDNAWFSPLLDDSGWTPVTLHDGFAKLGAPDTPAVVYFRKTISLPENAATRGAKIQLGIVERMDTVHINGRWIGASAWVENPRNYPIPGDVLRAGENSIVIRVFKGEPDGGFRSPPGQLKIVLGDQSEIPLSGEWRGKLSVDARPPHPLPAGFENWPVMPSVLYNGMIAPLAPLSLTGAIWYQGEANAGRADQYRRLLPAMIGDWRRAFGQGDIPFYIVSLAAFMPHRDQPGGPDGWAELRDAQAHVAATVKNSALALAIDKGDASDIHPRDKREVGERLALCALAGHYGKEVPHSGPVFRSAEPLSSGDGLRITFDHADGGLVVRGGTLEEFSIAGEDMKWAWARARLDGNSVIVTSPAVPAPKFVRYAWQSNPRATLYNQAGLPAVPFRTDPGPGGKQAR